MRKNLKTALEKKIEMDRSAADSKKPVATASKEDAKKAIKQARA